ncbi:hypothetical protein GCM10009868_16270 [Terrabacter aerolatus]|uniref:Nucleotidyltransferase n=1 Tax=Terrabacter aerolatus TaxID=422442 RepID=A0A512D3L9_9MICO|nr:nucleotidyltransferase family protein [Terrabacter aerolatus]GEO31071.1 hypothetical protein TAE01_28810 [Terrabacter aerolatus]
MSDQDQGIVQLLVDSVERPHAHKPVDWSAVDPDRLLLSAMLNSCAPALYLRVRDDPSAPDALVRRLQLAYSDQVRRHMMTLGELGLVTSVLDRSGIDSLVLKGPVLSERVWPRSDMRQYGDLDLLIDGRRLGEALKVLIAAGATLVDRNWLLIRRQMRAELSLRLPHGTRLDLHWNVVNEPDLRRAFRFPTATLLERSVPAGLEGIPARTLDPVDTVLHLAYHLVHSGGHRLVWAKDFDLALRRPGVDRELLAARARLGGTELALAAAEVRSRALRADPTGVGIPSAWTWLVRAVDRLRPVPLLPDTRFSGQIAFLNTRDTTLASVVALARDAFRSRPARDYAEPNLLHESHEDGPAREAYLAAVRESSEPGVV